MSSRKTRLMNVLLICLGPLGPMGVVWAEGDGVWRNYRMEKLFPYSLITSIVPAGGAVWFGGWKMMPGEQDGLGMFDRRTGRWSLRLESEGIFAEEINCLALDGQKLWVGCDVWRPWNRGLYLYDPAKQSHVRFTKDDGLPHYRIKDLCVDGDDVWAVTHVGAARYSKSKKEWTVFRARKTKPEDPRTRAVLSTDFLICVRTDKENVWVGSFEGLERYDKQTGNWESLGKKNSLFKAHVSAIWPDENVVYFSCPPSIIMYDRRTKTFRELYDGKEAGEHEVCCIRSEGDEVFFGTKTGGLYVRNKWASKWRVFTEEDGLGDNWVYALGADQDYVWCAGRMGRPLSRYTRRSGEWRRFFYREGIPCNYLYSVARAGKWAFVGTMANGFWKYDVRADRWHNLNVLMLHQGQDYYYRAEHTPIQFGDIYALLVHDDTVWIGTNHGLCRYPVNSARPGFEIISSKTLGKRSVGIVSLAAFGGRLLCGTKSNGLWAFDPAGEKWEDLSKTQGMDLRTVGALTATGDELWIGASNGLVVLRKGGEVVKRFSGRDGLPDPRVTALCAAAGRVWVGTGKGLCAFEDGKAADLGKENELVRAEVTSLLPAQGAVWVGTRHGLVRYDTDTNECKKFDVQGSGLAGDVVAGLASDGEELWVGTMGGGMSRAPLKSLTPSE